MASIKNSAAALAAAALLTLLIAGLAGSANAQSANPVAVIETNLGNITVELYKDKAPKTVANFIAYAKSGFYRGTIFHRVIGSAIQGGGFTADMQKKPTQPPIPNEAANGLSNVRGTLAMARTGDPNSATSQFFINTKDNTPYDHRGNTPSEMGYAVFAKVTAGMDVVEKIQAVPTGTKGSYNNVPLQPVVIKNITIK
jgi:cyclophilin family peptidyl-prolyl cis-trans isomerase